MRPVRLDLNGFASFRDPAVVDFTDADYFALVGPTGSGKSTVIDAMTFALYGSAPRWGRTNAIRDALAPTANRCTVRLVFDISGARYSITREVRRSGTQIAQKNVVLERFADPTATGDPTAGEVFSDVIAGDTKEVHTAIEELLGLSFEDFCQCVVLPQGEFATFLKAKASERQTILLKLLGAAHYEDIGRQAAKRASTDEHTAQLLTDQLAGFTDATQKAEDAARDREHTLKELDASVATVLPKIAQAVTRMKDSRRRANTLEAERARLNSVQSPTGAVELQTSLTAAEKAYDEARELEEETRLHAEAAAEALTHGPNRHTVELILEQHTEREELLGRREQVTNTARLTEQERDRAEKHQRNSAEELEKARGERDQRKEQKTAAREVVDAVHTRRTQLANVTIPDGIIDIGAQTAAAQTRQVNAADEAKKAEDTAASATRTLEELPPHTTLTQAADDLIVYAAAVDRATDLAQQRDAADTATGSAKAAVVDAEQNLQDARNALEQARVSAVAAELRPDLEIGHACPVCEQTVTTLPPQLAAPEVDAAHARVDDATRKLSSARQELERRAQAQTTASTNARVAEVQVNDYDTNLARLLPDRPTGETRNVAEDQAMVEAALTRVADADRLRRDTVRALNEARAEQKAAAASLQALHQQTAKARSHLHTVHGPLVTLHAPEVDDTDLPGAWSTLAMWAADEVAALDTDGVPDAERALTAATAALEAAQKTFTHTDQDHQKATTATTNAAVVAAKASTALQQLTDRLSKLDALLSDAPSPTNATALLEECTKLETTASAKEATARTAATDRRENEKRRDEWRGKSQRARAELGAIRDQLADLGVPPIDDTDVAAAWGALTDWVIEQGRKHVAKLAQTQQETGTAAQQLTNQIVVLHNQLVQHDIDAAAHGVDLTIAEQKAMPGEAADVEVERIGSEASRVGRVVAVELERAKGVTTTIVKNRERVADLQQQIQDARETHQVARKLADLMRSNQFPQWLANAALDTLVAGASMSLRKLSGEQYDLTHEKGDFFVIDHTDADSRRSVRTLSGGETFQASLALALALSDQLSTLAAGGTAKLDSIFLDEGFGTLDPDSLETVAGTLENLAQGERMVGVITHVAGLAERIPVRFLVNRDSRTSAVTREGT